MSLLKLAKIYSKLASDPQPKYKVGDVLEFKDIHKDGFHLVPWKIINIKHDQNFGFMYRLFPINPIYKNYSGYLSKVIIQYFNGKHSLFKWPETMLKVSDDDKANFIERLQKHSDPTKPIIDNNVHLGYMPEKSIDEKFKKISTTESTRSESTALNKTFKTTDGKVYKIVSPEEENISERKFSVNGPYGKAFSNAQEGDDVLVNLPGGQKEITISKIY